MPNFTVAIKHTYEQCTRLGVLRQNHGVLVLLGRIVRSVPLLTHTETFAEHVAELGLLAIFACMKWDGAIAFVGVGDCGRLQTHIRNAIEKYVCTCKCETSS